MIDIVNVNLRCSICRLWLGVDYLGKTFARAQSFLLTMGNYHVWMERTITGVYFIPFNNRILLRCDIGEYYENKR